MLTTLEGIYENGLVVLKEQPLTQKRTKVFVTFIEEEVMPKLSRRLGAWEGKYNIPDDFNEPLDDLKDYML
jgi:hypothetical protein